MAIQWIAERSANPPIYIDGKINGRKVATIRRAGHTAYKRNGKVCYRHRYQVVTRFVDIMGGAIGPVFGSLRQAKHYVEQRVGA